MDPNKIVIVPYQPEYAEKTVRMWRDSKCEAIGQPEIHSFENHVYFLNQLLPENFQVKIAIEDEEVAGMIAYNGTEINQLYIHGDYQGKGLGRRLLDIAKEQSSGRLTLYTFEVNKKAQQFYEKNGFRIIGRGHENEENLPDMLYEWKAE
ncbi:GNAT family acetyltransferase [[Bacillus] enclensis]|jgi:ribosomal protein S18 acetylase RimI-like enzyme|uniref:Acetyltransferase (GNAT) family protein n=1 Tax=[Bacillus] enclensis TaxID=1402860 RepID=A0A0V8HHZ9_9BACI|nr:GNAT family N-acetyltransferase [[Bacillus] enclensis]KSU61792.1 GNAT family acetyltransferase [[Bacillus] enclensis]OAT80023.1 GNAT family acetyltransferase [Bacillus sp. MKU004]QTC41388.1 GNAT family N-acetyltransferase [Bacillus sp. V3]SCC15349.1 Acetyltransferase (GNAT) family protein [[Bacillus] enclensis]